MLQTSLEVDVFTHTCINGDATRPGGSSMYESRSPHKRIDCIALMLCLPRSRVEPFNAPFGASSLMPLTCPVCDDVPVPQPRISVRYTHSVAKNDKRSPQIAVDRHWARLNAKLGNSGPLTRAHSQPPMAIQ